MDLRKNFFSQRVVQHWIELPDSVVNASTVNTLKNRLVASGSQQMFAVNSSPDIYKYTSRCLDVHATLDETTMDSWMMRGMVMEVGGAYGAAHSQSDGI